jgi:adenylyltransferase/sulfurtransferase
MFTERDAEARLPKAVAAARRVAEINAEVEVEPVVADVNRNNVEELIHGCALVLDGTDNFQTRYLVNDACVKHNVNWIYGAAVGSYGVTMTIRPGVTPCLRCVFAEMPSVGSAPTCDTAGVIMPIISIVAAVQVTESLKLLVGREADLHNRLMQFDVWRNEWRRIEVGAPAPDCPTCALRRFDALASEAGDFAAVLCGRDAVQINPQRTDAARELNLENLAARLKSIGTVQVNPYLLRVRIDDYELSIFRDGRAIIRGTTM